MVRAALDSGVAVVPALALLAGAPWVRSRPFSTPLASSSQTWSDRAEEVEAWARLQAAPEGFDSIS